MWLCGLIWSYGWSSNWKTEKHPSFLVHFLTTWKIYACAQHGFNVTFPKAFNNFSILIIQRRFLCFLDTCEGVQLHVPLRQRRYYVIRHHVFPVTCADVTLFSLSPPPLPTDSERHGSH